MLEEVSNARQHPGEPRRRWFRSADLDLYVWFGDDDRIVGFQLLYPGEGGEKALTWMEGRGFAHASLDAGEDHPLHYKEAPVLVQDGAFDREAVLRRFHEESGGMDPEVARFVRERMREDEGARRNP